MNTFDKAEKIYVTEYYTEDSKLYTVCFNNGITEAFSDEEFFEFALYCEGEILPLSYDELMYKVYLKRAYFKAMSFLRGALKPSKRVAEKLKGEGFSGEVIEAVLERLSEENSLDDERYCMRHVKKRLESGNFSCRYITCELKELGIDEDITKSCLKKLGADDNEIAFKLALKKISAGCTEDKIKRFLAGKGFSARNIISALKKVGCADGDYDLFI